MNPVQIARVLTHRRPAETGPALRTLLAIARECGAVLRLDEEEVRKHGLRPGEALELGVPLQREADICFALGGDGTVLSALRAYAGAGVPVFGVNYGEIGFLATVEREQAEDGFRRAFAGDFEVLSLPGIRVTGARGSWLAINDISIHRQQGNRVADLEYAVGSDEIGRVRCDGLVVATPAGSTGYNLANGGPVMAWGVEGFVVSFIAPHSLTARALVVAPQDTLAVRNRSREEPVDVTIDGRPVCVLEPGETLRVQFAPDQGTLAQIAGATFYQRLREKFGGWPARGQRFGAAWPGPPTADRPPPAAIGTSPAFAPGAGRPRGGGSGDDPSAAGGTPSTPMLHELRVENLLLMERAEFRLAPGLNVLTGETGAGKTLLAHALDLLLGGRARSGIVRTGAAEAYVEGVFARPPGLDPALAERLPEDAEEIVLARRVWPDGRTRAYVCGRSATVADLRELGAELLAFYGQHEHRKLTLGAAQLEVLDVHCGPEQAATRMAYAAAHDRVRGLQSAVAELRELAGSRERELDLVRFELRRDRRSRPVGGRGGRPHPRPRSPPASGHPADGGRIRSRRDRARGPARRRRRGAARPRRRGARPGGRDRPGADRARRARAGAPV